MATEFKASYLCLCNCDAHSYGILVCGYCWHCCEHSDDGCKFSYCTHSAEDWCNDLDENRCSYEPSPLSARLKWWLVQNPKRVMRFLRNKGYPDGQQITKQPFHKRLGESFLMLLVRW